ncbi:high frequency lysogenization protein HflD [Tenacibaculum sp. KUL152]|uniref:high frequency lysogenization protein HflD n=1 Tax=Alteromonas sp. 009811495 TaxID=3002962 RepID=UPI0012E69475|nr:high frequency lysogenization protein HflD [Alteromonas sp. 009811495]MEC8233264.1 high frequency lysogenization protein HflD [Pseudomonadota bacterium]WDT84486.1 high frequency lysogenization protein HflD [Alteromonas sp. 009811495]GFD89470.1 high frequency lysogenization protein HflD [Tenacibaculum sp. KUL152]
MLDADIENNLALAGVCQAAALVQQLARRGSADNEAIEASLSSILVTDPETPQQVFGKLDNLKLGYTTLATQLSDKQATKDTELTRYVASILGLERKLAKKPKAMQELAERISHVQRQLAHIDFQNPQIVSSLASIYSDIISPLAPRIQVAGNPDYLSQPAMQHKVRAILLAGVRAAVMWRQMGGKRRNILFKRKHILNSAVKALRLIN